MRTLVIVVLAMLAIGCATSRPSKAPCVVDVSRWDDGCVAAPDDAASKP
jgi:hypothetical protein